MFPRICRTLLPVLILGVLLTGYRLAMVWAKPGETRAQLRLSSDTPQTITPLMDEARVVSDDQLFQVLQRALPPNQVNSNLWLHALRLWGPDAHWPTLSEELAAPPSGQQMLQFFLDDATFQQLAGPDAPPYFVRSQAGVMPRGYDDNLDFRTVSSYHNDDVVATLAESQVPLSQVIQMRQGQTTVGQLLATSLRRFHLDRLEYEWTIISYARYAFPLKQWQNQFGETITVSDLVDELADAPLLFGPCKGTHRLEAAVLLYRADQKIGALAPEVKAKLVNHMARVSAILQQAQTVEGYWTQAWPRGPAAAGEKGADVYERILVTGHMLEWLALAPEEVQPPREAIVRAGQWLARTLIEMDPELMKEHYGPISHAVRALCLWRGAEAWPTWQRYQASQEQGL